MRAASILLISIACSACTSADQPDTRRRVDPIVTTPSASEVMRWVSATKLRLPAREVPVPSAGGFTIEARNHTGSGFARQAMSMALPANARGVTRLTSTLNAGVWVELQAEDVERATQAEATADALVFRDVRPAIDIVQMGGGDQFEELRVSHRAGGRLEGRWAVRLGPAVSRVEARNGRLYILSDDGYTWFQSFDLLAVDDAGTVRPAEVHVERRSRDFLVVVSVDTTGMAPPIALDPSFTSGGALTTSRSIATAVTLKSGKVLVSGTSGAELYDPATNTSTAISGATNATPRASLFADGRVAYVGGGAIGRLYDPAAGTWTSFSMPDVFGNSSASAQLSDGRYWYYGGQGYGGSTYGNILDPKTVTATAIAGGGDGISGSDGWGQATALRLPDGRVFLTGCGLYGPTCTNIYQPTTNTWFDGSAAPVFKGAQGAVRPDGKVLIAGGTTDMSTGVYDVAANSWSAGPPTTAIHSFGGSLTTPQGMLLIGGATDTSEFYAYSAGAWSAGPSLAIERMNFGITAMSATRWLIAGGSGGTNAATTTEILTIAPLGASCTTTVDCSFSLTCLDGVCCGTSTCPTGSKCNYATAKGSCRKDNGQTCTTAAECGSGFCVDGVCCNSGCGAKGKCNVAGKLGTCVGIEGQPCSSGAQCVSNFCADGFCCDLACTGQCEACSAAKKGAGTDGKCGPVAADTDPDNECPADVGYPNSCKADGLCDGLGKCRAYAKSGTACGATSCSGGTISGMVCNGGGVCSTMSTSCAPYTCGTTACKTSCASDADCATGSFCSPTNTCTGAKSNGQACASAKECGSGFCADGVCCNAACTGQCEACAEPASEGSCIPVTGNPRGKRPACAGDAASCGGTCNGTKASECTYPPSTKVCARTCADGKETKSACDGLGTCQEGDRKSCSPYVCEDAEKCRIDCTKDADCVSGFRCAGTTCIATGGAKCSDDLTKSISAGGVESSCGAFKCDPSTGNCRPICQNTDECAPGNICNTATKACEVAATDDSGGCSYATHSTRSLAAFGLSVLAAAMVRRRKPIRR